MHFQPVAFIIGMVVGALIGPYLICRFIIWYDKHRDK